MSVHMFSCVTMCVKHGVCRLLLLLLLCPHGSGMMHRAQSSGLHNRLYGCVIHFCRQMHDSSAKLLLSCHTTHMKHTYGASAEHHCCTSSHD
jgi:hypothetical protein